MGDPPETPADDQGHDGPPQSSPPQTGSRSSIPVGARCGQHPDAAAHALCNRCGNYMCGACSGDGQSPLCTACKERGAGSFPFSRDSYSFDGLLNYCLARFKLHWVTLVVATLLFLGVVYTVAFAFALMAPLATSVLGDNGTTVVMVIQGVGQVVQTVLQIWIQLGLIAILIDVLEGRDPELGRLVSQRRKLPGAMLQVLIIYGLIALYGGGVWGVAMAMADEGEMVSWAAVAVGGALGIVPISYVGLGLTFAMVVLVHDPKATAISALTRSFRIASGKRLSILGILIVSGVISFAGMLACCVGALATIPLGMMIYTALYMALARESSELA